jgi:hypothetical protein
MDSMGIKEEHSKRVHYKLHTTVSGDQQYHLIRPLLPRLEAYEALLLLAIAADEGLSVWKSDTSQAFQ